MNCHRISKMLSAYIDGELTGVEMMEIRRHLADCQDCETELSHLRAAKRLVGRLATAQPSADLASRICASLDQVQPYSLWGSWQALWQSAFQRLSPAVAAVAVVFLAMLVFTARGIDEKLSASYAGSMASADRVVMSPVSMSIAEQMTPSPSVPVSVLSRTRSSDLNSRGWIISAADIRSR
jgi:anti-sigma factor RsiW